MSLFKAKDYWSTSLSSTSLTEYDTSSITIAELTILDPPQPQIITGSLEGLLRIHVPNSEASAKDLLLEEDLGEPILSLKTGKFIPTGSNSAASIGLAILHPKKLVVYEVISQSNTLSLRKCYEHGLGVRGKHFTAANMCKGGFGRDELREGICVQSLDSRVQIFDLDVESFSRRLVGGLLPGPIVYHEKLDAFITFNSLLDVECYSFSALASAKDTNEEDEEEDKLANLKSPNHPSNTSVSSSKKVQASWSTNLGEQIIDIQIGSLEGSSKDIVCLGTKCIFALNDLGSIKWSKFLGYETISFTLFSNPKSNNTTSPAQNIIVSGADGNLNIYRSQKLIWKAKLADPNSFSIATFVSDFECSKGMITTLSDDCRLSVSYLGTESEKEGQVVKEGKEINYDDVDEEHRKLLGIIRASQSDTRIEPREKIIMRTQVPKRLGEPDKVHVLDGGFEHLAEKATRMPCSDGSEGILKITTKLFLTYTGTGTLKDVTVTLNLPDAVMTKDTCIKIDKLKGGSATPMIIDITFYANASVLPTVDTVGVTAMFFTASGEPRTGTTELKLPLFFFCRLQPATKEPTFKFKLDTNKQPIMLAGLFDDMMDVLMDEERAGVDASGTANYVLTFRYWVADPNGVPFNATVLLSKTSGRYRVQSHSMPSLWFISQCLCSRLTAYFENSEGANSGLELNYNEPHLPLQDFYNAIDQHFWWRLKLAENLSAQNDCAQQFRTIQKRLLLRFKDRNAVPLQQLDVLLAETYHKLLELSKEVENAQWSLKSSANELSCTTLLILLFIKLRYDMSEEECEVLSSNLTPNVSDCEACGWEEMVDSGMMSLLRTVLAKKNQDQTASAQGTTLQMPQDTAKLKKHISIVVDRIHKGARLLADE
ncbi:hypothetical protein TL16_g10406 [Triparma laevis f. inornata]|uniref:Protein PTHB1 n=1 Tax=Triparma laevis f. inornata TaxID=1714386 RepID=A0A9W7BH08_9STRA|nr:hypothetical protein TL16_g10406 [Triparma laevis f. inornata]